MPAVLGIRSETVSVLHFWGVILEVGGYVGNAAAQTASALTSIRICFVWIPIAVYVCGLIIMKFYHLDREFDGIIADLKERNK